MCMKRNQGERDEEGLFAPELFDRIAPAVPRLEALILNGIGEPLLHPGLETFIRRAKASLREGSWVGFQSNGLLLTPDRAESLVASGLDKICISVDAVQPEVYGSLRSGGAIEVLERAFSGLRAAKRNHPASRLRTGIEFVAMRGNLRELPGTLRWAARQGASFAIVSHLLPYDQAMAEQTLFDANTDLAVELFRRWKEKARNRGVAFERYPDVYLRYDKTNEDQELVRMVEDMKAEAVSRGIFLHLDKLFALGDARAREVSAVFAEARAVADETGIELHLPLVTPKSARRCEFVEEGGVFISRDGSVHPCYFLWHRYRCFIDGHEKFVKPRVFGSLKEQDLLAVWNAPDYRAFRENVVGYDYPYCFNCGFALCDYVQHEDFEQDCFVNTEPCGACLWCMGIFHCLR